VLDSLRQPLETGTVSVARANAHVTFPARVHPAMHVDKILTLAAIGQPNGSNCDHICPLFHH